MRNNVGAIDKIVRVFISITLLVLSFDKNISMFVMLFFIILSTVLLVTGLKGHCLVYRLFRINTNKNLNDKASIYEKNKISKIFSFE